MIRSEIDLGSCGIYFIYLITVFFTLSGWLNILSYVLIKYESLYIIIIEKVGKLKYKKLGVLIKEESLIVKPTLFA